MITNGPRPNEDAQWESLHSGVSHDDVGSATRPPLTVRFRHAAA
jgi:hypothetical protein